MKTQQVELTKPEIIQILLAIGQRKFILEERLSKIRNVEHCYKAGGKDFETMTSVNEKLFKALES